MKLGTRLDLFLFADTCRSSRYAVAGGAGCVGGVGGVGDSGGLPDTPLTGIVAAASEVGGPSALPSTLSALPSTFSALPGTFSALPGTLSALRGGAGSLQPHPPPPGSAAAIPGRN